MAGAFADFAAAGAAAMTAAADGGTAVAFTSGGVIAALCAGLLGLGPEGVVALNRVAVNAAITKVVIGHAGDSNDLDYLKWIMDQGATIGCDRFGLDLFNPTDQRVATIAALCAQGYADRIVLAHDAACYMDFFSGDAAQQALATTAPNWHYLHISEDVLPALREQGVTDDQISTMLVDNPRRYFTPAG